VLQSTARIVHARRAVSKDIVDPATVKYTVLRTLTCKSLLHHGMVPIGCDWTTRFSSVGIDMVALCRKD
jgi:hypothetical protein